ncbi:unnamed protein product [Rotaria sp. Silwood1]|nr:unnamed protein product [Rotaria sp. Silwood1]
MVVFILRPEIKTCKDLYEILGVSKTASEADLKKAYRKLALQFHPDKCKAPGATEAFKAIGKAFSILNDPKKRQQYDEYGHAMEPQYNHSSTGGRQYYYYSDADDDFSAEEIFNLFFGYTGAPTRTHGRRHQTHSYHFTTHSTQNTTHTFVQLLPKYTNLRETRLSKIQYYVKSDFQSPKTDVELDKFESSVIDEYISDLRHQCYREQQYKESMMWRAKMMSDNNLYRQAHQQATPSCTKLNNFVRGYA